MYLLSLIIIIKKRKLYIDTKCRLDQSKAENQSGIMKVQQKRYSESSTGVTPMGSAKYLDWLNNLISDTSEFISSPLLERSSSNMCQK